MRHRLEIEPATRRFADLLAAHSVKEIGLWTGACDPFAERVVLEFHHLVWDHVLKDIGCSLRPGGTSRNGSHSFHVLRIAAGNA